MTTWPQTPSQTVGPYFAYGLAPRAYGYAHGSVVGPSTCAPDAPGEHITLTGRLFDGEGALIPDAMIEIWQADSRGVLADGRDGRGAAAGFTGFARDGTGADAGETGVYRFATLKPGPVEAGAAPFIAMTVFMRGLLLHAFTRVYFADETAANARDPVLTSLPAERRETLLALRQETPAGPLYRFDIHMQGPNETLFFDL